MPAVKGDGMRGLAVFISDIRNCTFLLDVFSDIVLVLLGEGWQIGDWSKLCWNWWDAMLSVTDGCRGGPAPDRLSAALISRKFVVAHACVRGPRQQADVGAAGWCDQVIV